MMQNLLIFLVCFNCVLIHSFKLNVPRVLLPVFNEFSSTFVVEATEGGCYIWSTTRSDIVQLTPIDEDKQWHCSSKIIVSTITKEAARNIAVILAEDVHTKQSLRCDVIVDVIDHLSIITTTKELFMEEAPEDFEVKAYDDQGNEFTSLEGIEFDWSIIPLGSNKESVIRYISYRDSPYETPPAIEQLENENKKGYLILLEGVKSGSAKVTVRLPYPEYKHISPVEVQLMIVANLLLSPAEVYVMPGDSISFKVYHLNNGRMDEILLPHKQYYIEADDASIVSSRRNSGTVTALEVGKTRIVLKDRNVAQDDTLLKLPAATLHVVLPEYIILNLMPHKNWAILIGQQHDIVADVYDVKDHRIHLGDNVNINLDVTMEFKVTSRSENGSWLTGYGTKSGIATAQASLATSGDGKTKLIKPLTAKNDLYIYPQITIEPQEVILPWNPVDRPKYDVDLIAKGGDGKFLWTSSDHSIGVVSQTGHVKTYSNGVFEVSAIMMRNHHNRETAKFLILPPSRLEIVDFVMEAEIGTPIYLHIALYAEESKPDGGGVTTWIPFTKCQDLPFQIRQSDVKFKQNKTAVRQQPVPGSCGNIAMVAQSVGTSKITVTYYQDGKSLEDTVTVSAFKPLQLLQPQKDVVLAVGASIKLVFTGGPRPMIGRLNDHKRFVECVNETVVQGVDVTAHHSVPGEDFTVIEVTCHQLGETDVRLIIRNEPPASQSNSQRQNSSISAHVFCSKPSKILLQPEPQISDTSNCPMDLSSGNVVVHSTNTIDINVILYDDNGRKFLNFTSLNLDWTVQPAHAGILLNKNSVFPKNLTIGDVAIADRSYQTFKPKIDVGPVTINVTVIGYIREILRKNRIDPVRGFIDCKLRITASLALFLVENTVLSETSLTLFNHPGNQRTVSVLQGSGFFEIALSPDDDIVNVKYLDNMKEIEITPLRSGSVTIQLIDLCLSSKPATVTVTVVSIGSIRIDMPDKVEVGKSIRAVVRLYDENDNLVIIPKSNMIDLRPEFENKIASIQKAEIDPKQPWADGEIHYIVTGIDVGYSMLIFTTTGNEEDVSSRPINLQVFQPLKLYPRNGTILIFSSIQLVIKGGPQIDTEIQFSSLFNQTAKVNKKGVITGLALGKTKITAQAIGIHPTTGYNIIYAEDTVEITVVALQGVKILAPLTRFRVGATVPFWCFGVPDITPMILGTLNDPPIYFRWQIDDKLLADLTGVFHPLGINVARPDRIVLKLTGLEVGKTRVYVNVTVPGRVANIPKIAVMYSAFIDIEVIDQFLLENPKHISGSPLLMAPFAQIQLKTNLEMVNNVVYNLQGDQIVSTQLLADKSIYHPSDQVVTLTSKGLLKSHGLLGHALIIITSIDANGLKQELNIVVQVKPIHYMSLNVVAPWKINSNSPIEFVPLGSEFMLMARFHDDIGNTFQAGPTDLKVRTSRSDLIKVTSFPENGTLAISTKKEGHTMLKVWIDGVQKTTEYIKIHVEQSVRPTLDYLTIGDTICLWSPVVSDQNIPGTWKSSDNSLVEINPALDVAFVDNKVGTVTLTHSFLPSAPIHLTVLPVKQLEFVIPSNYILTNGGGGDGSESHSIHRFVLVLQSEKSVGVKTNNLILGGRCRSDVRQLIKPQGFHCLMEFSNPTSMSAYDLFDIEQSWIPETGQYACKLTSLIEKNQNVSVLKTDLILWASTANGEVESDRHNIKFLPSIYVVDEVILGADAKAVLTVSGLEEVLQQISVKPADSSILNLKETSSNVKTEKKFQIQLIDYHWRLKDLADVMGINVDSPITKQNIKVIVKISADLKNNNFCGLPAAHSPIFNFVQNYIFGITMAIGMIVIFFITFYFYTTYFQPIVNVRVNPALPPGRLASTIKNMEKSYQLPHQSTVNPYNVNTSVFGSSGSSGHGTSLPSGSSPCKYNCNCSNHSSSTTRDPVYGDPSTFYTSTPEIRRIRKYS